MSEVAATSIVVTVVGIAAAIILAVVFVVRNRVNARRASNSQECRQRQLLLEEIMDAHGQCAVSEATSRAEHDLNNLWLVLSMEAARLDAGGADPTSLRTIIATLTQIVGEGRQIVDALVGHGTNDNKSQESCDILMECQLIADFWGGSSRDGLVIESAFDTEQLPILCAHTQEFRLLALELCSIATEFGVENDGCTSISIGNGDRGEARLTVVCRKRVGESGSRTRFSRLSALAERACGEFYSHSDDTDEVSIAVKIPVEVTERD